MWKDKAFKESKFSKQATVCVWILVYKNIRTFRDNFFKTPSLPGTHDIFN